MTIRYPQKPGCRLVGFLSTDLNLYTLTSGFYVGYRWRIEAGSNSARAKIPDVVVESGAGNSGEESSMVSARKWAARLGIEILEDEE